MIDFRSLFLRHSSRTALVALAVVLALAPFASAQIIRDETPGQSSTGPIELINNVYTIEGADGVTRDNGNLLIHSFDEFNLNTGETALYTDTDVPANLNIVQTILSRVTGSNASNVDGTIRSMYPNAEMLFVNPNGIFFGPNFTLDVAQGFHSSTANSLEFIDDSLLVTPVAMDTPTAIPLLAAATPHAWGFLGASPTNPYTDIDVEGFNAIDNGTTSDRVFSFVASDISMGTDANPIDINTNGRSLNIIALNGLEEFRVENFNGPANDLDPGPSVTDLTGLDVLPIGNFIFRGNNGINTTGNSIRSGDVFIYGGFFDMSSVQSGIDTSGTGASSREGGDVRLLGDEMLLDLSIDASSDLLDAGDVFIDGQDSLTISPGNSISAIAGEAGGQSGFIRLSVSDSFATITANDIEINNSRLGDSGSGNFVTILGENIEFRNSTINAITRLGATPTTISIFGNTVDVSESDFFASTVIGSPGDPGSTINVTGAVELDITNAFFNASATGVPDSGDGGNITFTSPELTGFDLGNTNVSSVSGTPGTVTCNAPQCSGSNIIRDDTDGQFDPGPIIPDNGVYTIHGDDGIRRSNGKLVVHSFSDFNLDASETALYTDSDLRTARTVLTRVTGNNPSNIDGVILSDYEFADLMFVNTNGVFFGTNFTVDVNGSFHTSTADFLEFRNFFNTNQTIQMDLESATDIPDFPVSGLDDYDPHTWGFLSAVPADIQVDGFTSNSTPFFTNRHFSFVGGDVRIGSNVNPVDINTGGRDFTVIAFGRDGRVENFLSSNPDFPRLEDPNNAFLINGEGSFDFFGSVDTNGGANGQVGDVYINGGDINLRDGLVSTHGQSANFNSAGFAIVRGNDLFIGSNFDTGSDTGAGGFMDFRASNLLEIAPDVVLDSAGGANLGNSGSIDFRAEEIIADDIQIVVGDDQTTGAVSDVRFTADLISFQNSVISGTTTNFGGGKVDFLSLNDNLDVDLSGSTFDLRGLGEADAGDVEIDGTDRVDITDTIFTQTAAGTGHGGNLTITSTNLVGENANNRDLRSFGGGLDGIYSCNAPQCGGGGPASNIIRDNTPGQTNTGDITPDQGVYVIDGEDGLRRDSGKLIVHSFSEFSLDEGETALYTDSVDLTTAETILSRVTGDNPSQLDGTITSLYENADLVFANSNGLFFGQGFTVDVAQGFHFATADFFEVPDVADNEITDVRTDTPEAFPDVTFDTTFAWGFEASNPAPIEVNGFTVLGFDDFAPDRDFTFVGGDVSFGSDAVPIDFETRGRNLFGVAIGRSGRVEDSRENANSRDLPVTITNLSGSERLPEGNILVRGTLDTEGGGVDNGNIVLVGRNIDVDARLNARSDSDFFQNAGDVLLFGNDILIGGTIETDSLQGDGGDVNIQALGSIDFAPSTEIITTSNGDGTASGMVTLFAFDSINGDNLIVQTGTGTGGADSQGITIFAFDDVNLSGLELDGTTTGDGSAETVIIAGQNVDIQDANIDISTSGDAVSGGIIEVVANQQLDATNANLDTSAQGLNSNGGDILIVTSEIIDTGLATNVVAEGTGTDGQVVITLIDDLPDFDFDFDPDVTAPVVDSIEQMSSVGPSGPTVDIPLDDPIGFGDLQPVEPTPDVAAAPSDPEADSDSDDEQGPGASRVAAATGSRTSSGGGEAGSDPITEQVEEQIAIATASAEADTQKKSSSVPGVSLFTNASQRAPLVPRTCESIAGGDSGKSRLLARSNKRLPTSPEDWLIAFDTTGDRLITAAENPDLPAVAAIDPSDSNFEELQRNARTQRALAGAAAAVRGGRYDEAAMSFEQAVNDLEASGDPRGASDALLAYAQLQLNDGRYLAARQSLERALTLAEPLGDEDHTAAVRTSLGNALIGTGELVRAEDELTRGLNIVMASKDSQPAASALNNLGNRHAATRDFDSALLAYEQSAKLARKLGNDADEARALSGAARAAADSGLFTDAQKLLDRAMPLVEGLEDPRQQVPLYIHMGTTFAQFAAASPAARSKSLMNAYTAFDSALKGAEAQGDLRGVALANLNLGALYRDEQYRSEALYLTRLARRAAEGVNAPELLYRAHWQEGQILWAEHEVSASLAAHRRAIEILEETKPVASDGYGSSDANFRIAVGAVYQDTVDVLLQSASMMQRQSASDHLIAEARDTLEKLKAAELRDYFEDECIANVGGEGRGIDRLGSKAAVVYTVTLPDRIELLVGLPTGVERFTTKVAATRVIKTIDQFRAAVQNPLTNSHRALGKKIHEWTVAPYADRIEELGIETLVFIPDGRLRTLPFSALNNGDKYLSEQYATATALSLRLLTAPEIESENGRPVLAGVSESVQGFSELAAVDSELAEIQAIEGSGELFLNQAFTLDEIRAAVDREVPGVVHLATHAVFTGNPDTSFLLTYAGRVGFDDLSDVVGMTRADGAPLDLLVLSACETAVGNDRAGLGFTGSAIRAGARSALGSLWPISDNAARELMVDFYKGLQSPDLTKAEALRQAQATLRDSDRFSHPFYWAPFTLVNDWM